MPLIAVIFGRGGMGDVGRHAVKHCVERGIPVRAISREPEQLSEPIASVTQLDGLGGEVEGLEKIKVDLLSPNTAELEKALEGVDSVISCVGNRQPMMERWTALATHNITEAMQKKGVYRLVALTSAGINEDWPPMKWRWEGKVFKLFYYTLLRNAYKDITKAENVIKQSDLDYLIVRPTGLTPEYPSQGTWEILPPKSNGVGKDGLKCGPSVAKEDVSAYMLNEALSATRHKEGVTIATVSPTHKQNKPASEPKETLAVN